MCKDPTVLHDASVEGKVLPWSFLLGLLGFGLASSDAGPRGAHGFELTVDQQQAKVDSSCMDCQCMMLLIKFIVRKVCLVLVFLDPVNSG